MPPSGRSTPVDLVVGGAQAGLRLDQFLAAAAPDLSRRRARTLLDIGGVFVDGRRCKRAALLVEEGQAVSVNLGPALARAASGVGAAARAAVMLAPAAAGILVAEYKPNLVKKSVVGAGHADKGQIVAMMRVLLPGSRAGSEDAADALAIAICHAHHRASARALEARK